MNFSAMDGIQLQVLIQGHSGALTECESESHLGNCFDNHVRHRFLIDVEWKVLLGVDEYFWKTPGNLLVKKS